MYPLSPRYSEWNCWIPWFSIVWPNFRLLIQFIFHIYFHSIKCQMVFLFHFLLTVWTHSELFLNVRRWWANPNTFSSHDSQTNCLFIWSTRRLENHIECLKFSTPLSFCLFTRYFEPVAAFRTNPPNQFVAYAITDRNVEMSMMRLRPRVRSQMHIVMN